MIAKKIKLVSKELNHFGAIAEFFRDCAPETPTVGKQMKVYAQPVSVLGAQSRKNAKITPK
jgi:hypothetical protein